MPLATLLSSLFMTLQKCNSKSDVKLIYQTLNHCNKTICFINIFDDLRKTFWYTSTNQSNSPLFEKANSISSLMDFNGTAIQHKGNAYLPWSSLLFLYIILTRGVYEILKDISFSLSTVATMTYIKNERASYGSYYGWRHSGASLSLFTVDMIASHIKNTFFRSVQYGCFVTFP